MDKLTSEQRKKCMQANKSKGTKPEQILGRAMWRLGLRYRKNNPNIFGKPDFIFRKQKLAVFIDGEFWHGKDWDSRKADIKSNHVFWIAKIERNMQRDAEVNSKLKADGWTVLRFWGKEVLKKPEKFALEVERHMKNKKTKSDISSKEELNEKAAQYNLFQKKNSFLPTDTQFTFIDLFAGIGGFRIAMQNLGGKCVFSSELDEKAKTTYEANFGELPFGDITHEETKKFIPQNFDILCAGFPCQAFSIAGRRGGFEDTRGTLFFDVAEIIRRHQPKAFFLENVKGLINHDKGKTLRTILNTLRNDLGYFVPDPEIINAKDFGVPQNRERVFIIGFHPKTNINEFEYPKPVASGVTFKDIREEETVPTKYYLSTQYIKTLREHKRRHENKGNGFGYEIIPDDGIANAIVVGGMGRERNLVIDNRITDFTPTTNIKGKVNREGIRKMTPREWARLQGFPEKFNIVVADASAYKQFGNSVAIPAIEATAKKIMEKLEYIK